MNALENDVIPKGPQLAAGVDLNLPDANRTVVDRLLNDPYELALRSRLVEIHDADYVSGFHCDRAYVKKGEKYFYVDRAGERINDQEYDSVENFSDGLAVVGIDTPGEVISYDDGEEYTEYHTNYHYVTPEGDRATEATYSYAGPFSEGVACVGIDEEENPFHEGEYDVGPSGNRVYIDKKGEVVIPGPFTSGGPFKNGFAEVGYGFETGSKGCYGPAVIDTSGEILLDNGQNGWHSFIRLDSPFSEDVQDHFVYEDQLDPQQCGAYDLTGDRTLFPFLVWYGNDVFASEYDSPDEATDLKFPRTFGSYTLNGMDEVDALLAEIQKEAKPYYGRHANSCRYTGLFKLSSGDGMMLSTDQEWHSELIYSRSHSEFKEGRMGVAAEDDKWFYIDENGVPVGEQTFYLAEPFNCGVAVVCSDSSLMKYKLIDPEGSFVSEQEFESIGQFKDGVAPATLDGREVFINTQTQIVF